MSMSGARVLIIDWHPAGVECSRLEYPVEGWLGLDLQAIDIERYAREKD